MQRKKKVEIVPVKVLKGLLVQHANVEFVNESEVIYCIEPG